MKTPWTDKISRENPLPEYPRPQMVREPWQSLNGRWDYAITKSENAPARYDGGIVVPFSPETELSGVMRNLRPDEYLWYHREVTVPESFAGKRVLLHFDAVDQEAVVWVNGRELVRHVGGYLPFEADITEALSNGKADILVRVIDISDTGSHSRGKQNTKRGGIWYTPQSGIWQSVWMEAVPECYVKKLRITPDFDNAAVEIAAETVGSETAYAHFMGESYALPASIPIPDMRPWSPDDPYLYDFSVTCGEDKLESYFAMRKFSVEKDKDGIMRLFLNGRPCFHNGLLDQGYWSDSMYTPACEEAMEFDILTAKAMGFNVLRKHIKVEPLRWYHLCDKHGMLVWQDMINGGGYYNLFTISSPLITGISFKDNHYRLFARSDAEGRAQYKRELREMIEHLYNCPCIALWVPFNEGWGQFDAAEMYEYVLTLDKTRTIDHASGWHDQGVSDVRSDHVYFRRYSFKPDKKGRAVLLSEFGGYNLACEGHCFNTRDYGYRRFKSEEALEAALTELYQNQIAPAKKQGLAAAIYTELSDVEDELNGLISYDRQVVKLAPEKVRKIIDVGE